MYQESTNDLFLIQGSPAALIEVSKWPLSSCLKYIERNQEVTQKSEIPNRKIENSQNLKLLTSVKNWCPQLTWKLNEAISTKIWSWIEGGRIIQGNVLIEESACSKWRRTVLEFQNRYVIRISFRFIIHATYIIDSSNFMPRSSAFKSQIPIPAP